MIEINFNKVRKNYGFENVLSDINFDIHTGDKIALVGENGTGKSTILKLIMGIEKCNDGTISIRTNSNIKYLKQEFNNEDIVVKDYLMKSFTNLNKIKNELEELEQRMKETTNNKIIEKYCNKQEEYLNNGGYEIEERINKIINYFKIGYLLDKNMNELSGGEKRIIMIISILLDNPTIILLDEPTNHLDLDMIKKLENYLKESSITIIFVSHDRYFINKIANKVFLIENTHIYEFIGNYDNFINENEKRIERLKGEYKNEQKKIHKMEEQIKQLKFWGNFGAGNEMFSKRAFSIEKRLNKMEKHDRPKEKTKLPVKFNMESRSGKDVIVIDNYSIDNLILPSKLEIYFKEKVCLMGPNGSGKSTILKDIINNNRFGSNVVLGYIPQNIIFEDEEMTIIELLRKKCNDEEHILRSKLTKFKFYKENINKQLRLLSGGERIRLKLFLLLQNNINLIIMDEPTNHIDIETKEILEDALINFSGTVLFVSHDRYFINKVASKVISIENKKLVTYIGNYDKI